MPQKSSLKSWEAVRSMEFFVSVQIVHPSLIHPSPMVNARKLKSALPRRGRSRLATHARTHAHPRTHARTAHSTPHARTNTNTRTHERQDERQEARELAVCRALRLSSARHVRGMCVCVCVPARARARAPYSCVVRMRGRGAFVCARRACRRCCRREHVPGRCRSCRCPRRSRRRSAARW